ncbi:MAG TPA: hydrolase [Candidatus Methanofastidiosa archaeon]|nr:hydrolase [Candidatus Methanofastidiosa archaeon]HPR41173.1 hydrolase [Candidatus Methanofastidiosa archaeon]
MAVRLRKEDCVFVVIDVQERFMPVLDRKDTLLSNIKKLVMASSEFDIPLMVTEQYPEGLGRTVEDIDMLLGKHDYIKKDSFSCFKNDEFRKALSEKGRGQLVLSGIEAQVCVTQTALDGLGGGYEVFIAADAIDSRKPLDREISIGRMRQAGAVIEATESILFYMLERHTDEKFKNLQWIVKSF